MNGKIKPRMDATIFGLFAVVLILKGVWHSDLLDILSGILVIMFSAGITLHLNWFAAISLFVFFAMQLVWRLMFLPMSWPRIIWLLLNGFCLVLSLFWIRALWRHHKGLPGPSWPFRT